MPDSSPTDAISHIQRPNPRKRRRGFWASLLLVAHLAGALTSVRAVMEVRTPQGAIAWVVALNTFPYLSVPAYWVFGSSRFEGYVIARRLDQLETHPLARQFLTNLVERQLIAQPGREGALLVEKLARTPVTTGNEVELLVDGEATFASMFEGMEQAEKYVLMQTYILRDDGLGREMQQRLIDRARAGVAVRLIYDEIGSAGLSDAYLYELRAAGVQVHSFNSSERRVHRWQLNFRNHRKIVVVDGRAAWVGGHNVGDEYLGRDPKLGRWRDTHVKITGPAVFGLQMSFLEDWHWACREVPILDWDPQPGLGGAGKEVLCLPSGPADALETCTLYFLQLIHSAKDRLWIATPYFVPDEQFVSALQLAALRGVEVRILIPDKTDMMLVNLSGWSYLPELGKVGIRVFRYTGGFLHQKVMLVDDDTATVGTVNFDNRSFRLNFEVTVQVSDENFAGRVERMLEGDFANSREVFVEDYQHKHFWERFLIRSARLLSPVQ